MSNHAFANIVGNNVDTTADIPIISSLWRQYRYTGRRRKLTNVRKVFNFCAVMVGILWIRI